MHALPAGTGVDTGERRRSHGTHNDGTEPSAEAGVRRGVPSLVQTRSEACSALQTVARRHQAVVRLVRAWVRVS